METKPRAHSYRLTAIGVLLPASCLGLLAFGQSYDSGPATAGVDFDLTWHTVDGGGAMFTTGGEYELSGTIGQHDAGGPMTGGDFELTGGFWVTDGGPGVSLASSAPAHDKSLWRSAGNIVRLTFSGSVAQPAPGQVKVQRLLAGGLFGPDLSGSFSFGRESGDIVLRIQEVSPVLAHRTWYAVRNAGDWTGVAPFEVHYLVQVGDANGDRAVLFGDLSFINTGVPINGTSDNDRKDINGDGNVLFSDLSAANTSIPSLDNVPKPTGH